MLVFDEANKYTFPNVVINFQDNTYWTERSDVAYPIPRFNVLVPIRVERGKVNTMSLYKAGSGDQFIRDYGTPNCIKTGFGADLVYDILENITSDEIGVWVCNLRDSSATAANTILLMKYKVVTGVEVTNAAGEALYVGPTGEITTSPTTTVETEDGSTVTSDNTRLTRDVLHAKYSTASVNNIAKWTTADSAMAQFYNTKTADAEGYYTIPLFMIVHGATSTYGNSCYFRLGAAQSESDAKIYYAIDMYDGQNSYNTDPIFSLNPNGGEAMGESYFIEEQFNSLYGGLMRFVTSNYMQDAMDMISKYMEADGLAYDDVDIFDPTAEGESLSTGYVVDEGSLDVTKSKAFKFDGGSNGDPEKDVPDYLYAQFFKGKIVKDITSVIRWRINYIPDLGYDDATVAEIKELTKKRTRMTVATVALNGNTFDAAISDHNQHHIENMPTIRQICALQNGMMYNQFIKRTVRYPAGYFDTMALIARINNVGNPYTGFAGFNARWTGFIDDTMTYMPEDAQLMNRLDKARINVLMKDAADGGYLSDQKMNTKYISDQTEFNNAMLISDMLYDLIDLIHRNSFNFNEPEDIAALQSYVDTGINSSYAPHAASLDIQVSKLGSVGKDKYTTKIVVTVNLKDINKYAIVDFLLTDE